jgi:hypothetical protein
VPGEQRVRQQRTGLGSRGLCALLQSPAQPLTQCHRRSATDAPWTRLCARLCLHPAVCRRRAAFAAADELMELLDASASEDALLGWLELCLVWQPPRDVPAAYRCARVLLGTFAASSCQHT